jgi:hypothetical protein
LFCIFCRCCTDASRVLRLRRKFRRFLERDFEGFGNLADEFLLIAARALQFALQHLVAVRIQRAKTQVLELQFDGIQTETLGDGRVDLQGLAGAAAALDRRHHAQGAHVVHAVRELDHDDADVAHHGQQHFAEALGLGLLAILELNLIELADAVDQFGHDLAEDGGYLGLGGRRVFDDVVQNGRHQGVGIQAQIGEDVGHRHRMRDVGFARNALLAAVLLRAEFIRFAHPLDLRGRQIGFEFV